MTKDVFAAICQRQCSSVEAPCEKIVFEKIARQRYDTPLDSLLKTKCDFEEISERLNIGEWPENVMPKTIPEAKSASAHGVGPTISFPEERRYLKLRGYDLSAGSLWSALSSGIDSDDDELMVNALKCIRVADRGRKDSKQDNEDLLRAHYSRFVAKSPLASRANKALLIQWAESAAKYGILTQPELTFFLRTARDVLTEPVESDSLCEAMTFLSEAAKQYGVNVAPCALAAFMIHPMDNRFAGCSNVMLSLWSAIPEDMLRKHMIALCKVQKDSMILRIPLNVLIGDTCGSTIREISRMECNTAVCVKSLNLDHWPESCLP
jgi:hypothetical protein